MLSQLGQPHMRQQPKLLGGWSLEAVVLWGECPNPFDRAYVNVNVCYCGMDGCTDGKVDGQFRMWCGVVWYYIILLLYLYYI